MCVYFHCNRCYLPPASVHFLLFGHYTTDLSSLHYQFFKQNLKLIDFQLSPKVNTERIQTTQAPVEMNYGKQGMGIPIYRTVI